MNDYGEHWRTLEDRELVRFHAEPEIDYYDDSYLDDIEDPKEREALREELHDRINREGHWIYMGQFRTNPSDPWETADSIGGFIGRDFFGSGYDRDVVNRTLESYRDAVIRTSAFGASG